MSHTARDDLDSPSTYVDSKKNKKQLSKSASLIEFIEDQNRKEPLVGLQYVVEMKILGTDETIVRCNICRIKGHIKTMVEHLIGLHHIKTYMEMYYFSELRSIKHSDNKSKIPLLIKDFAREIERAEGTQNLQIEYISAADMKGKPDNWVSKKQEHCKTINPQIESPILDRRQMALKYSETFRISSRAEASVVLKLTQQLSDSLEQYFMTCKELEVEDSGVADNTNKMYETSKKILPSSDYGNGKLGLESTVEKPCVDTEPTLSAYTTVNAHSFDSLHEKIEVTSEENYTSDVISSIQDVFLKQCSSSGSQLGKLQKFEGADEIPFVSAQTITHRYEDPSHSIPLDGFASQSCTVDFATHSPSSGQFQVEQNSEHISCSPNTDKDVKASFQPNPSVVSTEFEIKAQSDLSMENIQSDFDTSSLQISSTQPIPSSSVAQRKTSKTLSPDILQLLKGKDANTVTNILKTLSPFYPALQDVNLEILAQVLVNTGALD